jgi:membrane-associated protease RseP (regulator of RpoE activity)
MKLREQKVSLYWLLPMGVVGALMIATEVMEPFGRLSFGLFLFYAFMYLSLLPHEFGHALAARLAGWKVFGVTVGIGKPLWTRKFGDVTFTLNAFPTLGWVNMGAVEPRLYRLKFFLIVLAGPLVHAGIVAFI